MLTHLPFELTEIIQDYLFDKDINNLFLVCHEWYSYLTRQKRNYNNQIDIEKITFGIYKELVNNGYKVYIAKNKESISCYKGKFIFVDYSRFPFYGKYLQEFIKRKFHLKKFEYMIKYNTKNFDLKFLDCIHLLDFNEYPKLFLIPIIVDKILCYGIKHFDENLIWYIFITFHDSVTFQMTYLDNSIFDIYKKFLSAIDPNILFEFYKEIVLTKCFIYNYCLNVYNFRDWYKEVIKNKILPHQKILDKAVEIYNSISECLPKESKGILTLIKLKSQKYISF